METKTCAHCSEEKPATDEHFAWIQPRLRKDGYTQKGRWESRCRPCHKAYKKKHNVTYAGKAAVRQQARVAESRRLNALAGVPQLTVKRLRRDLPPPPTAEELARWYSAGCPLRGMVA